ncbi:MAG: hypothetical protein JWO81_1303 [Alphaproteobacteria bacterium]|nr:hypothetical protein [Alphaproteobacteria bacterium]
MDELDLSPIEMADRIATKLTSAIVIAGALVAVAIYARPSPPRYQAVANGAEVLRVDTRSGTILSCSAGHCYTLVRHGKHLEQGPSQAALPGPAAPAPAKAPAAQPAPAATH